jgi:hypothetical protein
LEKNPGVSRRVADRASDRASADSEPHNSSDLRALGHNGVGDGHDDLTYLDCLNISITGHFTHYEFSFSRKTIRWILSSFLLDYSLSQFPEDIWPTAMGREKC